MTAETVQFYNQCAEIASTIPNFKQGCKEDVDYDIDVLLNEYCSALDSKDDVKMNQYICALFVRYQHMFSYFKNKSANVDDDTIIKEWLFDGFQRACKYRSWLKDSKLIHNRRGAEICLNNAIDTSRKRFYNKTNAQKRSGFFFEDAVLSTEALLESGTDVAVYNEQYPLDEEIVNKFLSKNDYESGILVDLILNSEAYISSNKLNSEISSLDTKYAEYFMHKYTSVNKMCLESTIRNMSSKKGRALSNYSRNKMSELKNDNLIKSLLHN